MRIYHTLLLPIIVIILMQLFGCSVYERGIAIPKQADWTDFGLVVDSETFGTAWDAFFEGYTPGSLVKKGDTYYLYYVGADDYISQKNNVGPAHRLVGVATSIDGVNWTKYSKNPVLTYSSSGNPEEGVVSVGVVVDEDGVFHAYYGVNIATTPTTSNVNANVHYATSTNGLDFTLHGIVLNYSDSKVWGNGDELHSTMAWKNGGTYYAYYVPNGVSSGGKQGVVWGTDPKKLTKSAPLRAGSAIINGGVGSVIPISSSHIAYFITRSGVTEVRTALTTDPTSISLPVQTYKFGGDNFGKVFYLDQPKRTWFMIYDTWEFAGLMLAPVGAIDTTGPTAPSGLAASPRNHESMKIKWNRAIDSDTGVVHYNIYRNNVKIATTKKLSHIEKDLAELTQYNYQIRAVNYHGTEGASSSLRYTSPADALPPGISSVSATGNANTAVVVFDEPVEKSSAETASNYAIFGLSVSKAVLSADAKTVTLTITNSTMTDNKYYSITVINVADKAKTPNKSNARSAFTFSSISGLGAYWRLDQGTSVNSQDTSGYGSNGTVKGDPGWTAGRVGQALNAEGKDDYIEIDSTPALDCLFSNSFTVTGFARPADIPSNTTKSNQAYTLISGPNVRVQYDSSQKFSATTRATSGDVNVLSGQLSPGNWYHVSTVVDDSSKKLALYVYDSNGNQLSSVSKTYTGRVRSLPVLNSFNTNKEGYYSRYRIGVHDPDFDYESNFFKGLLDDIRVYNRVLTTAEITNLARFTGPPR